MITDFSKSLDLIEVEKTVAAALKSGTEMVSLRNNGKYDQSQIDQLAQDLILRFPEKKIFIHNPDNRSLEKFSCYHFSERFLEKAVEAKKHSKNRTIAVSVHSIKEAERAFESGLDYVFYSPVYHPISKPDDKRETVEPIKMKNLYLLGGINRMRGRALIERGFCNLAGISFFYGETANDDIAELSQLIMEKNNE